MERRNFSVGDILRCHALTGGLRVWQITAVILGTVHQENIVCIRTLDKIDPIGSEEMSVPEELLLLAIKNGVQYMPVHE